MNRSIFVCALVLCLAMVGTPVRAAVPDAGGKAQMPDGPADFAILKPTAAAKHAFVCLPGEPCAEKKTDKDPSRGFGKPDFLKKPHKPVCMVVRGTGSYCTAEGSCYDAQGKTDNVNYKKQVQANKAPLKYGVPVPVVMHNQKERGFSLKLGTFTPHTAVSGVRGFVPSISVIDESDGSGARGMRGYGNAKGEGKEKPAPQMVIDLGAAAFVVVMNTMEAAASIYINEQYMGNVSGGAYATYLAPSGPAAVSIVSEIGEEMNDNVELPSGELVYFMIGPYEELEKEGGKGYADYNKSYCGGGPCWATPAR